jgi:hypothetical protein
MHQNQGRLEAFLTTQVAYTKLELSGGEILSSGG